MMSDSEKKVELLEELRKYALRIMEKEMATPAELAALSEIAKIILAVRNLP